MSTLCQDRVVVVTGAGRGIGRGHAIEFARAGAKVVVNDLGAEVDGRGASAGPAGEVVEEIRAAGGEAVVNGDDVSDPAGAERIVQTALDTYGGLDVLVNNAGILRDRMVVNMTPDEWDGVMAVHLRGTFLTTRAAGAYWRDRAKQGLENDARIINTSSPSGLLGNPGQSNYGAAKAGIAGFTIITAAELGRYGVTVNAVSPGARTRMTEGGAIGRTTFGPDEFDPYHADNIAPLVVWLGSKESAGVTGRVFNVVGGRVGVMEPWHEGPFADKGSRWEPEELGAVVPDLLAQAAAPTVLAGRKASLKGQE
ncbi:MAG TPA: SDR family oxidoreductase [Acidimicrobiales bacterium]|nr:SDR family oxidoreductase [Acidimicrobiales bacterium]